jgi:hypothetical protein
MPPRASTDASKIRQMSHAVLVLMAAGIASPTTAMPQGLSCYRQLGRGVKVVAPLDALPVLGPGSVGFASNRCEP